MKSFLKSQAPFLFAVAGGCLLLAGCNVLPQPSADLGRHFTLSGPVTTAPLAEGVTVRPVRLAGHLRNRAMAVRVAENEVIYLEDIQWAESLDDALTQLLRAKVGAVAGNSVVTVQVQRFELVRYEGNGVQLAATYSILTPGDGGGQPKPGTFQSSSRTWDGKDYGTLVSQLRDAAGELGDAVVAALPKK
jgi:uncharacterized lipoprotein YmbA